MFPRDCGPCAEQGRCASMKSLAAALIAMLALAACHAQNSAGGSAPQAPSGNATSGRPSGANGTPGGGAHS